MHSVILKVFLTLGLRFLFFLRFSCIFLSFSLAFWIPTCWYHKREDKREKNEWKIKNVSGTTHIVIRPLVSSILLKFALLYLTGHDDR